LVFCAIIIIIKKNKAVKIYQQLQAFHYRISPYNRAFIGIGTGFGIVVFFADENAFALYSGIGIGTISTFQLSYDK